MIEATDLRLAALHRDSCCRERVFLRYSIDWYNAHDWFVTSPVSRCVLRDLALPLVVDFDFPGRRKSAKRAVYLVR